MRVTASVNSHTAGIWWLTSAIVMVTAVSSALPLPFLGDGGLEHAVLVSQPTVGFAFFLRSHFVL